MDIEIYKIKEGFDISYNKTYIIYFRFTYILNACSLQIKGSLELAETEFLNMSMFSIIDHIKNQIRKEFIV